MRQRKREREMDKMRSIIDKRALGAHYRETYGIRVTENDLTQLTEKQLLIKLECRLQSIRERKAAIKLQSLARMLINRKTYKQMLQKRQDSARRIQKAWRGGRNKNDIANVVKAYKNMNATKI